MTAIKNRQNHINKQVVRIIYVHKILGDLAKDVKIFLPGTTSVRYVKICNLTEKENRKRPTTLRRYL